MSVHSLTMPGFRINRAGATIVFSFAEQFPRHEPTRVPADVPSGGRARKLHPRRGSHGAAESDGLHGDPSARERGRYAPAEPDDTQGATHSGRPRLLRTLPGSARSGGGPSVDVSEPVAILTRPVARGHAERHRRGPRHPEPTRI